MSSGVVCRVLADWGANELWGGVTTDCSINHICGINDPSIPVADVQVISI